MSCIEGATASPARGDADRDDEHERVPQELDAVERPVRHREHPEGEVEAAGLHHVHEPLVAGGLRELDLHGRPRLAKRPMIAGRIRVPTLW